MLFYLSANLNINSKVNKNFYSHIYKITNFVRHLKILNMKTFSISSLVLIILLNSMCSFAQNSSGSKILLRDSWTTQSSENIKSAGKEISLPGYRTEGWYPASMPSTILAALVANKVYPDTFHSES